MALTPLTRDTPRCHQPCHRFIGCRVKDCILCANNPNKRCTADENFQEAYADNQVLRSKCDSDIHIEIVSTQTGLPADIQGAEIQVRWPPCLVSLPFTLFMSHADMRH